MLGLVAAVATEHAPERRGGVGCPGGPVATGRGPAPGAAQQGDSGEREGRTTTVLGPVNPQQLGKGRETGPRGGGGVTYTAPLRAAGRGIPGEIPRERGKEKAPAPLELYPRIPAAPGSGAISR